MPEPSLDDSIRFEEPGLAYPTHTQYEEHRSIFTRAIIFLSGGLISTNKTANLALVVVSCILILLSLYLVFGPRTEEHEVGDPGYHPHEKI